MREHVPYVLPKIFGFTELFDETTGLLKFDNLSNTKTRDVRIETFSRLTTRDCSNRFRCSIPRCTGHGALIFYPRFTSLLMAKTKLMAVISLLDQQTRHDAHDKYPRVIHDLQKKRIPEEIDRRAISTKLFPIILSQIIIHLITLD